MRSRDYECWVVDVTSSEEGSKRVEEGTVPLVRKLSDTSRHARASLMLQAGRQYIVQWRRTAICGTTEAESEDPFVTSVWVSIALNGKTLGEGLLSDLNQQTRTSLDGVSSSTALTGSPLWGDSEGAPAGLVGKLSVSFYRSPEVIRRALKDRAYSEPQSPQSPSSVDHGGGGGASKSASITRRSPLLFRGAVNSAPTVFNFFFEVAAETGPTDKKVPQSLRRSVSTSFENVFIWSKAKGKKALHQASDDGMADGSQMIARAGSIVEESSEEKQTLVTDMATPVSTPEVEEETKVLGRPRAATLRAINGRLVVIADPYQGSQALGSSTVDTDYVLRGRPRAATMAAPIVQSQRAGGMTCANSFLSAVSAFEGERIVATRPRRALSDAPAQWHGRAGVAEGNEFEAVLEDVATTTGLVESNALNKSEELQTPLDSVTHNSLTPVVEANWESVPGLAVAYRYSLHQDLAGGKVSKLAILDSDSDSDSSSLAEKSGLRRGTFEDSAIRYLHPQQTYSTMDLKAIARNRAILNCGDTIESKATRGLFARSVGNGRSDIPSGTVDTSHDHAVSGHPTALFQPVAFRQTPGDSVAPAMPSPARLQIYEAKCAAIAPLEDTLRALQEEEANLLHKLEVRRLNEYQDRLSKQIKERRLRVDRLEQELSRDVCDDSQHDTTNGEQDSLACPPSPARSLTTFLHEPRKAVMSEYSNQPSQDRFVLARHQLVSSALSTAPSDSSAVNSSETSSGTSHSLPSRPRAGSLRQAFIAEESRLTMLSSMDMRKLAAPFSPRSTNGVLPLSLPLAAATTSSGWQSVPTLGAANRTSTVSSGIAF